jgi:hypothetical protein
MMRTTTLNGKPPNGKPPDTARPKTSASAPANRGRCHHHPSPGSWVLSSDPLAEALDAHDGDIDEAVKTAGFEQWSSFGATDGSAGIGLDVSFRRDRDGDLYLVQVITPLQSRWVVAHGLPCLMSVLSEWLPAVEASARLDQMDVEEWRRKGLVP